MSKPLGLAEQIKLELEQPGIERWVERYIHRRDAAILRDVIKFAEYLERKHNRGYVVYDCYASGQFTASTTEEYLEDCDRGHSWVGEIQWRTDLAAKVIKF